MSDVMINNTYLGGELMSLLSSENIQPGSQAGYELCKQIWTYHPLGGKLVEKPVKLALSKPRTITIDAQPKEMLAEAFNKEWEKLGATNHIRDVMFINRTYGAGGIVVGADKIPTTDPIDPWNLPYLNLYFNQLDPLNMAGSIVTNQNPNAPDFQKPLAYTTAAGKPYHPSRSVVVFNGTPIYLQFQSSAFGFTGRSVFQRALYPLKSFIQSMITDDLVTFKSGLIIAKQKPAGSIVNRLMQNAAGIKRTYLQEGGTGNVLSIDIDEEINSIDLTNTATSMTTARDNIIANIAAASDVPAMLLKDEAFTQGFGEGTEDAKAIVQYIDGIRVDMESLFDFFDKIVMHRAWNKEFYEAVKKAYPEIYRKMSYEQAFYSWQNNFKAEWESLMEEPPSEKVKVEDIKLKGITELLRTMLPVVDPQNRAALLQWAQDNINEMPEMFASSLQLDADAIAEYEIPEEELKNLPRLDAYFAKGDWANPTPKADAPFLEQDHPRDTDGKFTSGSGGSASTDIIPSGRVQAPYSVAAKSIPKAPEAPRALNKPAATEPPKAPSSKRVKELLSGRMQGVDVERLPEDKQAIFVEMYEKAAANKDAFDETNAKIAKELGGKAAIVPLKGSQRAVDKITKSYDNDPTKIKDLLRTTIEIKSLKDVDSAIDKLKAQYGEPSKLRNLLDPKSDSLGGSGYRDVNMVVEINGSHAEVQINLPAMLEAKEKAHIYYEEVRIIVEDAAVAGRKLNVYEEAKVNKANENMKKLYDAAWESITKA